LVEFAKDEDTMKKMMIERDDEMEDDERMVLS